MKNPPAKKDGVSSMSEVREMSFISLVSSVFLYHSGLFVCAVERWEIMRDAWAGVKGSERECFHSTNCLILAQLMLCDWTFIVMRCCETKGNTDSANRQSTAIRNQCNIQKPSLGRDGRVLPLHPRLLGLLRIQTTTQCSVRVKTGGHVLNDLCSHLEVHWLEWTSRLVYVQLSFSQTLLVWETFAR